MAEDDDMDWDEEVLGEMEGGEPNDRFSSYWDDDTEMTYPLILAKIPQIHAGRISLDLFYDLSVLRKEFFTHQVVLNAPAQVDGHVVISIDGVNRQFPFQ